MVKIRIKQVEGYDGRYLISDNGDVYSLTRWKTMRALRPSTMKGYKIITLTDSDGKRISHLVHRIVAKHFVENKLNKPHVNHIDFDRSNNNSNNLKWVTHEENISFSKIAGRYKISRKGKKISIKDARKIKRLYFFESKKQREIAKIFNVTQQAIWFTIHKRIVDKD